MEKLRLKTPEEIKKGLERVNCADCPYDEHNYEIRISHCSEVADDAIAYILQLERERDAAVEDLKSVVASNYFDGDYCKLCKYNEPDGECYHTCIPYTSKWGWEWRGVQNTEDNE